MVDRVKQINSGDGQGQGQSFRETDDRNDRNDRGLVAVRVAGCPIAGLSAHGESLLVAFTVLVFQLAMTRIDCSSYPI
jgi:hypothetical protein